jgi:hypothetical protein
LLKLLASTSWTYYSVTRRVPEGLYYLANWCNLTAADFTYPQSYIELDDKRSQPILPSGLLENQFKKVNHQSMVANYIAPRYQDEIEAGGLWLSWQGLIDHFWIDLWSEKALNMHTNPESDLHPQVQLIEMWLKDYETEKGRSFYTTCTGRV